MILNVSGRTDIVAFYTDWFFNRLDSGFVMVRNPFNPKLVSKISFKNVDLILFCTKNPIPILNKLDKINIPFIFHVTLTPYKNDIEPNVIDKNKIIVAIKELSLKIGKENLYIRYDPIFLSDKYNLDYHIKAFKRICELLDGYVCKIIVSFIDNYVNVRKNMYILKCKNFTDKDYEVIGRNFSKIAKYHNMSVQTCFENRNLVEYGFIKSDCISRELAYKLTGKNFGKWTSRKGGKCGCAEMVDIGVYNTCKHLCKYCYANYQENTVFDNNLEHDKNSPLLIGNLKNDDIIKERIK